MATNGFTFIPNQPIIFDLDTDPCQGFLDSGRCVEFKRSDDIECQIKRDPCGDNLVCTELEEETFGDDLFVNGPITGSGTGWTYDEPWDYGVNEICTDGSSYGVCSQTVTILVPGNYTLTFAVNVSTNNISVEGGPITVGAASAFGIPYDTTGTYTIEIIVTEPTDYLINFVSTDSSACLQSASFRQRLSCYNGAGWYATDGGYQHLPGYNTALTAYDDVFTIGRYYKVVVSVSGMTDGSVVINVGSNASESITSDITSKAYYINSGTDTGFNIIPDSDFDGFITIEDIYELTEISYLYLVDMDGNEVADLSPYVTYVADRINIKFNIDELLYIADSESLVPNGCYRIAVRGICNPANTNLVINPEFLDGTTSFVEGWDQNNGSFQYDTSGGGCTFIYDNLPMWSDTPTLRNNIQPLIIPGTYEVIIEIESNTDTTNIGAYVKLDQSYETQPPTFYSTPGVHTFNIVYNTPATETIYGGPRVILVTNFNLEETLTPGEIRIVRVEVRRIENDETLELSNCIQIKSDAEMACHKWVEGYGGCYGYGFDFRQFKLGMRIPILKDGPEYPVDQNVYLQSDGNRKRTKGERDKIYRVVTDKISEIEHDTLSTMLICDSFLIDDTAYFFAGKAYNPEWPRNRRSSIARVEIDLIKDAVIMASDCGSCDAAPTFIPCTLFCETALGLKSNYPEPATAGWYMKDGENKLQYSNGTIYTASEKTCDGYVNAFDTYGAYSLAGPWRWNSITEAWEPIVVMIALNDTDPIFSVSYRVLTGCIGRIQTSTDGGENWNNATGYKSSAQLLSGVDFNRPGPSFRWRIEMKCAICLYYGAEWTIYE